MLSATTEHALRALVHLARLPMGTSVLGRELAVQACIPANYLSKILWTLRNAGFVEASRGQGGGYRLAVTPDPIRLIDVVELFDGVRGRSGCLLGEKHDCSDGNPCSAHVAWKEVKTAYIDFLEQNTIASIATHARREPPLATLERNA